MSAKKMKIDFCAECEFSNHDKSFGFDAIESECLCPPAVDKLMGQNQLCSEVRGNHPRCVHLMRWRKEQEAGEQNQEGKLPFPDGCPQFKIIGGKRHFEMQRSGKLQWHFLGSLDDYGMIRAASCARAWFAWRAHVESLHEFKQHCEAGRLWQNKIEDIWQKGQEDEN